VSAHQPSRLCRVELDREARRGPLLACPVDGFVSIRGVDRAMRDVDDEPRLDGVALEQDVPNLHRTLFTQKERRPDGAANELTEDGYIAEPAVASVDVVLH
jgi:hypothetical protein